MLGGSSKLNGGGVNTTGGGGATGVGLVTGTGLVTGWGRATGGIGLNEDEVAGLWAKCGISTTILGLRFFPAVVNSITASDSPSASALLDMSKSSPV